MIALPRPLLGLFLITLTACGDDAAATGSSAPAASGPPELSDLLQIALAEEQPSAPLSFSFDWPSTPLQVEEVSWKEMLDKPSMCVQLGYQLQLGEQGPGWVLQRSHTRIDRVNDTPFAELPEFVRAGVLGGLMVPDLAVLPDGSYGGLVSIDDFVASLPDTMTKLGADEEMVQQVVAMSNVPQFRAMIEQGAGDPWRAWVETWVGLEGAPGEEWSSKGSMEVLPGLVMEVDAHMRFHGFVAEPAGHVLLSARITMGDDAGVLLDFLTAGAEATGQPLPVVADGELDGVSFTSATVVVAVIDPRTLVPYRATSERLIHVRNAGTSQGTQREAKEWRISAAPGGGQ